MQRAAAESAARRGRRIDESHWTWETARTRPGFNAQQNADTEKTIAWVADLLERSNNLMSSNYEKVKEARAAGAWKNEGHEDLMKGVLAAAFPDDAAAETSH